MIGEREQGLAVGIEGNRLVISIGINALMTAVKGGDDWPDAEYRIVNADMFAADIATGLEQEEEDGTTDIHLAIDKAALWALEMSEGVEGVAE